MWIYLSETMCEKGTSIALFINLALTIAMGASMSTIIRVLNGWIYLIFGVFAFAVNLSYFYHFTIFYVTYYSAVSSVSSL